MYNPGQRISVEADVGAAVAGGRRVYRPGRNLLQVSQFQSGVPGVPGDVVDDRRRVGTPRPREELTVPLIFKDQNNQLHPLAPAGRFGWHRHERCRQDPRGRR